MKKNSIIEISPLERLYENVQQPIATTSSQTIAKPLVSGRSEQLPWWKEQINSLDELKAICEKKLKELSGNCH